MTRQEKTHRQLMRELTQLGTKTAELEAVDKERRRFEAAWLEERQLLLELLSVQERERRLIAYEIHDSLAQQLAAALCYFESARQAAPRDSPAVAEPLGQGLKLLQEALAESRRLINGSRPPLLDEFGLAAAVGRLARESEEQGGPTIDYLHQFQQADLPPLLDRSVFRIVQEALGNARRHSRSEKVRLELIQAGPHLRVLIRDWGIGFDPTTVPKSRVGLEGIRERAKVLGGKVTIESAPGEGTQILVEVPIPNNTLRERDPSQPSADAKAQPKRPATRR